MSVKLIWDAPPIRLRFLAGKDSSSAEEILPNLGMKAPVSEQAEISTIADQRILQSMLCSSRRSRTEAQRPNFCGREMHAVDSK